MASEVEEDGGWSTPAPDSPPPDRLYAKEKCAFKTLLICVFCWTRPKLILRDTV